MNSLPLITAHSGSDGTPDNSMEFVRYALTCGADALEVDIRRSEDGTLFLSHDENDGADAPRLSDVFRLVRTHSSLRVNCDLKTEGLERPVFECAAEFGLERRILFSGSVDAEVFAADEEMVRCTEVYYNIEKFIPDFWNRMKTVPDFDETAARSAAEICRRLKIRTVNAPFDFTTQRMIDILKSEGIGMSLWTPVRDEDLRYYMTHGAAAITTRRPAAAVALRAELAAAAEQEVRND